MRKKVLGIGVAVLFVGVALLIIGGVTISGTNMISSHYSLYSGGKYVSYEVNSSGEGRVIIFGNGTLGTLGLVTQSNLSSVNASNIADYAITPTVALGGLQMYSVNHGSYFLVIFSSTTPEYVYTYLSGNMFDELAGLMIGGFALFLGGVVTSVVGIFMRPEKR